MLREREGKIALGIPPYTTLIQVLGKRVYFPTHTSVDFGILSI